jgi:hypothetical protein
LGGLFCPEWRAQCLSPSRAVDLSAQADRGPHRDDRRAKCTGVGPLVEFSYWRSTGFIGSRLENPRRLIPNVFDKLLPAEGDDGTEVNGSEPKRKRKLPLVGRK